MEMYVPRVIPKGYKKEKNREAKNKAYKLHVNIEKSIAHFKHSDEQRHWYLQQRSAHLQVNEGQLVAATTYPHVERAREGNVDLQGKRGQEST